MNQVSLMEKWKPIQGYEGLYEISNMGNVKSLIGWNGRIYYPRIKLLQQSTTTTGYKKVELSKNGVKKSIKVHRLVATAFIENKDNKPFVNHMDGNRLNNNIDNLEWCTRRENIDHAMRTGLIKKRVAINEKELEKDYCELRMTYSELMEKYSCSRPTIRRYIKDFGLKRNPSKYGIIIDELKQMFEQNMTNTEIAQIYNCNPGLIARRRYQYKNNMI